MLAYADEKYISEYEKNNLIQLTKNTITNIEKLARELAKIQSEGVAYDNEEYMEGVMCCGSLVFGINGKCIAALGFIIPKYHAEKLKMHEFSGYVKAAAKELSKRMGDLGYDRQNF